MCTDLWAKIIIFSEKKSSCRHLWQKLNKTSMDTSVMTVVEFHSVEDEIQ